MTTKATWTPLCTIALMRWGGTMTDAKLADKIFALTGLRFEPRTIANRRRLADLAACRDYPRYTPLKGSHASC